MLGVTREQSWTEWARGDNAGITHGRPHSNKGSIAAVGGAPMQKSVKDGNAASSAVSVHGG